MAVLKQDEIKGFRVLPVRVPTTKSIAKIYTQKELIHYIYLKQHLLKTKDPQLDEKNDKSIFFINLPKDVDIKSLRNLFRQVSDASLIQEYSITNSLNEKNDVDLNKLTSEFFDAENKELNQQQQQQQQQQDQQKFDTQNLRFPINTGIVTFVDKSALKLFLNNVKKLTSKAKSWSSFPVYESSQTASYLKFINTYKSKIYNISDLKQQINVSLANFNRQEQEEMDQLQESATIVDDDGFQLVVSKHRKTKAAIMGKTNRLKLATNQDLNNEATKKSKKKEKQDFYRFQIRERKKQEMNQLLMKFKEDQARIRALRDKKRFRPY